MPMDDELVLYDARTSQVYVLNSTAARIWSLCDGSRATSTLAQDLAETYQLDYRQALSDVDELVSELRAADLILVG